LTFWETGIILLFLFLSVYSSGQNEESDNHIINLKKELEIEKVTGNDSVISELLFSLGDAYYKINDFKESGKYILNSIEIEKKTNRHPQLAERFIYLGKINHSSGDYPSSLVNYNKALDIFKAIGDKGKIADISNNIGIVYFDIGSFEKALKYYLNSLNLAEELNDKQGIAKSLNNIGIVYYEWGNKEKALEYYQKSLRIEEDLDNTQGIGDSYNNIGIIYSDWDQNELAIDYYNRALEIYNKFLDDHGTAMAMNNMGESYFALGDFEKALEFLTKSLEIEQKIANKHGIAESYHSIAEVYFKHLDVKKSIDYNLKSFMIADSLKLSSVLLMNYELFYRIYSYKKDYPKALEYYRSYALQKDTIYNRQLYNSIAEIQTKYEIDRLEKEKDLQYSNIINKENEIRTQRTYLIVIFILMIIFGILVYYDIKSRIKANVRLKGINKEITKQKEELIKTLEELSKSEAKYRNLIEYSPTGIIYLDKKGNILELNNKILEILGSPNEEETRKINCLNYPPLVQIGLSDAILKSIESGKMVFNETQYKSKWGKRIYVRYYVTPILNRRNNVSGLIINVEDVTLSKEFEKSKILTEQKYRILVENSLQAMLIIQGGKLIFANSRMEELSQYKFKELADLQDDWLKLLIHPEDYERVFYNIKNALEKKKIPSRNEYKYIRKDGVVRWMESLGSIVNYDGKPAILVVAIDVTERKEAESILIDSEKQLRKANAMKDKFFSIIAHDLKNPFNAILGFSNLLFEAYDNFDDTQRKTFIKNICDASGSTFKLLQNLLEWSRTQTGKIEINPEKVDINIAVQENIAVLKSAAEGKKIKIRTKIPQNTFVFADDNMVKAVIRNLLSNAIKFTGTGGSVEISTLNSGSEIEVSITDNGLGIEPENLPRLFRIDDQFKTKGTHDEQGSGLGLILCKEFVEMNGGKIWVESKSGKGSSFKFTLPSGKGNEGLKV
jgi:PAS domain S-box-containing protein